MGLGGKTNCSHSDTHSYIFHQQVLYIPSLFDFSMGGGRWSRWPHTLGHTSSYAHIANSFMVLSNDNYLEIAVEPDILAGFFGI